MPVVYMCPFFKWEDKCFVSCEGGKLRFCKGKYMRAHIRAFCASNPGWEKCPMAAELVRSYEQEASGQ